MHCTALHSVDDQKRNVQHRCSTTDLDLRMLSKCSTNKRQRALSNLYIGAFQFCVEQSDSNATPSIFASRRLIHPPTHQRLSSPIIPINSNILMTKITRPHSRIRPSISTQINNNNQILIIQQLRRPCLIHLHRLPIHQQPQHPLLFTPTPLRWHETHTRLLRHDRAGSEGRRVADRAEDAAPIGVAAVHGCLEEWGARDAVGDGVGVLISRGVADGERDELGGAFAVADD